MDDKGKVGAPAFLCLIDGVSNAGYLHGIGECPCNDFSCVQVHDACQIDKAVMSPNISNVCTPDGVGTFRIELFIQNVVKLVAEIRVSGGGSLRLYPLCLNQEQIREIRTPLVVRMVCMKLPLQLVFKDFMRFSAPVTRFVGADEGIQLISVFMYLCMVTAL